MSGVSLRVPGAQRALGLRFSPPTPAPWLLPPLQHHLWPLLCPGVCAATTTQPAASCPLGRPPRPCRLLSGSRGLIGATPPTLRRPLPPSGPSPPRGGFAGTSRPCVWPPHCRSPSCCAGHSRFPASPPLKQVRPRASPQPPSLHRSPGPRASASPPRATNAGTRLP